MRNTPYYPGSKFNRLTVLSYSYRAIKNGKKVQVIDVLCDCGTEKQINATALYGGQKSCGCIRFKNKVHCPQGHPFDTENTYLDKNGWKKCRTCGLERKRSQDYKEYHRIYRSKWRDANRERKRATDRAGCRRRRARKKSNIGVWEDDSFVENQLWLYQNGKCHYCSTDIKHPSVKDRDFHLDHVKPLSRGGKHCITNVVLACIPCNMDKSNQLVSEWKAENESTLL